MENASKALIIAGAILLSILIIGLGVYIYNNAAQSMQGADMSDQQKQNFNEPFLQYAGNNVSGSNLLALLNKVQSNNLKYKADDVSKVIKVNNADCTDANNYPANTEENPTDGVSTAKAAVKSGYTYKVTVGYDNKTGLITTIGYTKNQ